MIIKNGTFNKLKEEVVRYNKKIVVFGAGVLGTVTTAAVIVDYDLCDYIDCYVDNDKQRQQAGILIGNKCVNVQSGEYLSVIKAEDTIIILAISRCSDVLEEMEKLENLKRCTCYIMPMMCIANFKNEMQLPNEHISVNQLIPKKIHYMWLGKKELPKNLEKCIESWKKYCPEYDIICWNEDNYDISKNDYMREAYEAKAYGFVPDYARLDILYTYGGIYLDTDVELIKPLDDLLYQDAFCGVEKWQTLNFGGCSGAKPQSQAVKAFLDARMDEHYTLKNGYANRNTCGYIDTLTAMKFGYKLTGQKQKILDMTIYPSDYFQPYDYMSGRVEKTQNTFSIHHFNGGWLDEEMIEANKKIVESYNELEIIAKRNSEEDF